MQLRFSDHFIFCIDSSHVLDEAERSLHDALCVLVQTVRDSRVIWGGGWPEILMSRRVEELARKTPGKKSLAIDAFAAALRQIPVTIADNAGLDSADLVSQLRAAHSEDGSRAGIDVITGEVGSLCAYLDFNFWFGHQYIKLITL